MMILSSLLDYVILLFCISIESVSAFQLCSRSIHYFGSRNNIIMQKEKSCYTTLTPKLAAIENDNEQDFVPSLPLSEEDKALSKEIQQRHEGMLIEKTRCALEEQNKRSFLKSRPRKLPYQEARLWVQKTLGVETKEEWDDFLEMGYIKSSYIPNNPEEYYTLSRQWISWNHFLKGTFDDDDNDNRIAIDSRRGIFD